MPIVDEQNLKKAQQEMLTLKTACETLDKQLVELPQEIRKLEEQERALQKELMSKRQELSRVKTEHPRQRLTYERLERDIIAFNKAMELHRKAA